MAIFDDVRDVVVEQLSVAPDAVKLESLTSSNIAIFFS